MSSSRLNGFGRWLVPRFGSDQDKEGIGFRDTQIHDSRGMLNSLCAASTAAQPKLGQPVLAG
jgi:hypothetical protein